jgi:hypothetical protein
MLFSIALSAQELCLEERKGDDAIIKRLEVLNGKYYITVDVVQVIESEIIEIKNVNPKLRTFEIDPNLELHFCAPENANMKIRDLINKRNWILETLFRYSAKNGKVTGAYHHSCSN